LQAQSRLIHVMLVIDGVNAAVDAQTVVQDN